MKLDIQIVTHSRLNIRQSKVHCYSQFIQLNTDDLILQKVPYFFDTFVQEFNIEHEDQASVCSSPPLFVYNVSDQPFEEKHKYNYFATITIAQE